MKAEVYGPNETKSSSKMPSNVSTLAGLPDHIVEPTQHVGWSGNMKFIDLVHQCLQLQPLCTNAA